MTRQQQRIIKIDVLFSFQKEKTHEMKVERQKRAIR